MCSSHKENKNGAYDNIQSLLGGAGYQLANQQPLGHI